jgi:hypothetical protein
VSIFDFPRLMIGTPDGMRAMSKAEIDADAAAQYAAMRQAEFGSTYYQLLANYRPPVCVPQGWQEWYEIADEQ